jgi:3-oxoacyl-[acyl-carrier-protein] synthase I
VTRPVYIHEFSTACALGKDATAVRQRLLSPTPPTIGGEAQLTNGRTVPAGRLGFALAGQSDDVDSRCNQLSDHCLNSLGPAIERHLEVHGPQRMAVVVGTCTSGVGEGGLALSSFVQTGDWPKGFRYSMQELGDTADHIGRRIGARGPVFGISTACTSGAKALASAARMIRAGLCDVAVAGGIDVLCDLTLNGFAVLDSMSDSVCNPFSVHRRGINLGDGGALFLVSAEPSPIRLAGWGESADAHHISAPDPEGTGAEEAMRRALASSGRKPGEIGYLNLHGTATKLNDLMEARAVSRAFGPDLACSSTKPMTGHMLGAAGACEAAFTILALQSGRLPAHVWDGAYDPEMPRIRLVPPNGEETDARCAMSCSYAFGGNNIALVLEME